MLYKNYYKTIDGTIRKMVEESPCFIIKSDGVYEEYKDKEKPKFVNYQEYLNSDEWKAIRNSKYFRSKKKCSVCGNPDSLHVHHLLYRKEWTETKVSDLRLLCERCHHAFHRLQRTGKAWEYDRERNKQKKFDIMHKLITKEIKGFS